MAELSNYPAVLGRKAMTAISCVHRMEWHSESIAGPRFICLDFESPRIAHLTSFLHRPLLCPLMSAGMALCPASSWSRQRGNGCSFSRPCPSPGCKENPCLYLSGMQTEGGPDGKIQGGGFYPHPADPQKSLFLTRTVFITIA